MPLCLVEPYKEKDKYEKGHVGIGIQDVEAKVLEVRENKEKDQGEPKVLEGNEHWNFPTKNKHNVFHNSNRLDSSRTVLCQCYASPWVWWRGTSNFYSRPRLDQSWL